MEYVIRDAYIYVFINAHSHVSLRTGVCRKGNQPMHNASSVIFDVCIALSYFVMCFFCSCGIHVCCIGGFVCVSPSVKCLLFGSKTTCEIAFWDLGCFEDNDVQAEALSIGRKREICLLRE